MPLIEPADIRNVAITGHNNSGKTSLADALLYKAKAVPRRGSIDDATSVFDFDPEEKQRKVSIDLAIASCQWKDKQLNILDTPGYYDFIAQTISALNASENTFLCINALAGIMVNTRKVWQAAEKSNRMITIVVTKLDQENIKFENLIARIKEVFGQRCVLINLPDTTGGKLSKVVSVIKGRKDIPEALESAYNEFLDKIVELDDKLLEKYLDGKELTVSEIQSAFLKAMHERKVTPILCTSVVKDVGISELLDYTVNYLLPPGSTESKSDSKLVCQVFRTQSDPFVGRLSYLKIHSGTLYADKPLYNARTRKACRIGVMYKPFGKDQKPLQQTSAGDIVVITKVDDLFVSDLLSDHPETDVKLKELEFPSPMISLAVEPKSKQDEAKMSPALQKMSDSDPTFKVARDSQTLELVITGMSHLHIDVTLSKMKRIYEVNVITKTPKIPFKETITVPASGHHKHKKQTGGHGQYGEVSVKIEPAARGSGFEFINDITQGKIPGQYIPSVEKGVREKLEKGVIAGYPVVDLKVSLHDGSYHDVDSSNESFKIAGSKAFKQAFMEARPVLLEPIVNMEVYIPSKFMGDITGQINSKRGRVLTVETQQDMQVIKSQIPLMEITNYASELNSATGGEGFYSIEFSHYDVLIPKIAETIIARARKEEEEE